MIRNLAADQAVFTSNVFLVTGERTVIIDAGWKFDVVEAIRTHVDDLDALILTHAHPDHVGNIDDVTAAFDVECWGYDPNNENVDRTIEDGERVKIGDRYYEALFTPGHAVDHLCFYNDEAGILFAGDLFFANGAIGRTDFEGGDPEALAESLDRIAARVGPNINELHTGHGPSVDRDVWQHVERAQQSARMQV